MDADSEGFLRPKVDTAACVQCGLCEKACPILHVPVLPAQEPEYFGAVNRSDPDRACASSGGMFILLARWILERNGVVFGAAFQSDFSVAHSFAETEAEVLAFCGSKYLQSRIGDTFRQAKAFLEQGRWVLFSGTPCQIMGLKSFLGEDHSKLITVDIVCHGVPSPAVWQRYVQERVSRDGKGALQLVSFRAKGERGYSTLLRYEGGEYRVPHWKDPYMRGFLKELYLRPSCYQCIAKGTRRVADFTLADLWGAGEICPELDDGKGVSLVLLHSEKAKRLWSHISISIRGTPVGPEVFDHNPAAVCSMVCHPKRDTFFCRFQANADLINLICELTAEPEAPAMSLFRRVRGKIGLVLRGWFQHQ